MKNNPKGEYKFVSRTETIQNNANPEFVTLVKLDYYFEKNQIIQIRVEDDDQGKSPETIGMIEVPLATVLTSKGNQFEADISDGKAITGRIFIRYKYLDDEDFNEQGTKAAPETPGFLHFLKSGWSLSMSIAIDYTGSNGDPSKPDSLHYLHPSDPNTLNQYEASIWQVGSILESYDQDKKFPVIGFGAIQKKNKKEKIVSHDFYINESADGLVYGAKGVLDAYRASFALGLKLYGPTLFAPLLSQFIGRVEAKGPSSLEYQVIVIMTDGAIHDMPETTTQVVRASKLPISIIIIGVGNSEELANMNFLDSDGKALADPQGNTAA